MTTTRSATRIAASVLGLYAGFIGALHGYHEIQQGSVVPDGVMISAIGPPCQPEVAAHACFPAMTLIPNFLITGILAVIIGSVAAIWAVGFVRRQRGGLVLMLLSIAMLLVGGGFVALFIGLMAGLAGTRIHQPLKGLGVRLSPNIQRVLASLWPWSLIAYFTWVFPVQWFLGNFFADFLRTYVLVFFFCFDLGLPLLSVFTGLAHDNTPLPQSS